MMIASSCTSMDRRETCQTCANEATVGCHTILTSVDANGQKCQHIDANPLFDNESFDFMSMVSDIQFIPLETKEESRLGHVTRLTVTDKNIVVADNNGIFCFDANGRFKDRRLYVGRNATLRHDFALAPDGALTILSGDKLVQLPQQIESALTAAPKAHNATQPILTSICWQQSQLIAQTTDGRHIVRDSTGIKTEILLGGPSAPRLKVESSIAMPRTDGNRALITNPLCDTIMALSNEGWQLAYVLNYANRRIATNPEEEIDEADLMHRLTQDGSYYFAGEAIENESTLFFKLRTCRARTIYAYFDRQSQNLSGGIRPMADYVQMPPIFEPLAAYADYFVTLFHPYQLDDDQTSFRFKGDKIAEAEKDKIANVTHEDNPVVALFKVKPCNTVRLQETESPTLSTDQTTR